MTDFTNHENEWKLPYILEFIKIAQHGLVKPYDPTPVIDKIRKLADNQNLELDAVMQCCPPCGDIRDSKDFKPYIEASLKEFAEILELKVSENEHQNYRRNQFS